MPYRLPNPIACTLLKGATLILLAGSSFQVEAQAQEVGCQLQPAGSPARQVLRCQDGVTLEADPGADFTLLDRNRDGQPDAATLRSRALLVDVQARSGRRGFQVLTPQAIAAVRGTRWAVDVSGGKTSVFVLNGRVAVRRANARREVNLGPGEGVDVEAGDRAALIVKRWPRPRVNALLGRFGLQMQ
jgi:ferric-dicitrate binding protein FerR (iron transport regulator)